LKYLIKNCENCTGLNDISYPQCASCIKADPDLDLIIYKNKLFTKHHYIKEKYYTIYPFFIDVLLKQVKGKILSSYEIKDASVNIIQTEQALQPTYTITIPGLDKDFHELVELKKDFDERKFNSN